MLLGARVGDKEWSDPVTADIGDTIVVNLFYSYTCPVIVGVPEFRVKLPADSAAELRVTTDLRWYDGRKKVVMWSRNGLGDGLLVKVPRPARLEYVPNSTVWIPSSEGLEVARKVPLQFVSAGALPVRGMPDGICHAWGLPLGPIVPGSTGNVQFAVVVRAPSPLVIGVLIENTGDAVPNASVTAEPGGTIDYRLQITNEGVSAATNVKLVHSLPPGIEYVSGSTRTDGEKAAVQSLPDGICSADKGLILPSIQPGQTVVIRHTATVSRLLSNVEELFEWKSLASVARVIFDGVEVAQDQTTVQVNVGAKRVRLVAQVRPHGSVNFLASSSDNRYFAAATDNGDVSIWDGQSRRLLRQLQLEPGSIASIRLNSDGRWLAVGQNDGLTRIWQTTGGDFKLAFRPLREPVTALVFSDDSACLASAYGGTVTIRSLAGGSEVGRLDTGLTAISSLVYDGQERIWLGGRVSNHPLLLGNGVLQSWSCKGWRRLSAQEMEAPVDQIVPLPGSRLAVASGGRTWFLDSSTGKMDLVPPSVGSDGPAAVAFSCDSRLLALAFNFDSSVLAGAPDTACSTLAIVDAHQQAEIASVTVVGTVQALEFSEDSARVTVVTTLDNEGTDHALVQLSSPSLQLISTRHVTSTFEWRSFPGTVGIEAGGAACGIDRDGEAVIYDVATGLPCTRPYIATSSRGSPFVGGLTLRAAVSEAHGRHTQTLLRDIWARCGYQRKPVLSPDSRMIAYLPEGGTHLVVADVLTGRSVLVPGASVWDDFVFSPDSRLIARRAGRLLCVCEALTGRTLFAVGCEEEAPFEFSPDSRAVCVANDGEAVLYDTAFGKSFASLKLDEQPGRTTLKFSPDGRFLLAGDHMWDVFSMHSLPYSPKRGRRIDHLAVRSDGTRLLRFGQSHFDEVVLATETSSAFQFSNCDACNPRSVAYLGNQGDVLLGTASSFEVWRPSAGQSTTSFVDFPKGITSCAISTDGEIVAVLAERSLYVINLTSGGHQTLDLRSLDNDNDIETSFWLSKICVSPDKSRVAIASHQRLLLVDTTTWKVSAPIAVDAGSFPECITFTPDSAKLVCLFGDHTLWTLDLKTQQAATIVFPYPVGFEHRQFSSCFSPDSTKLYLGGLDEKTGEGRICAWNVASGELDRYYATKGWPPIDLVTPDTSPDVIAFGAEGHETLFVVDTTGANRELPDVIGLRRGAESVIIASRAYLMRDPDKIRIVGGLAGCSLFVFETGWAVVDADGRFDASDPSGVTGLCWVLGDEVIEFEQLKNRFYDPGLLGKILGFNKEPLLEVPGLGTIDLPPEVKASVAHVDGVQKLIIKLRNRGGGIGQIPVWINGKQVIEDAGSTGARGGAAPDPDAAEATLELELAAFDNYMLPDRPTPIEVRAWNSARRENGTRDQYILSRAIGLDAKRVDAVQFQPAEFWAVIAGVTDYKGDALNLQFASTDARSMATALQIGAERLFGPERVHIKLLTSPSASGAPAPTKENLLQAMSEASRARPGDVFVLYLAGHGVSIAGKNSGYYFLTSDAYSGDADSLSNDDYLSRFALSSRELDQLLVQVPAAKQVIILDTCAAGAVAKDITEPRQLSGDALRAQQRMQDRTGGWVLMGAAADKVSYETSKYGQGLLTYALLRGMRSDVELRDNEFLDVSRLLNYARDSVPQLAVGIGGVQDPRLAARRSKDGTIETFDIGQFIGDDRSKVPVAQEKPMIAPPVFLCQNPVGDHLNITGIVTSLLSDFCRNRGGQSSTEPRAVIVRADVPGAVRPQGVYTLSQGRIRMNLLLEVGDARREELTVEGGRNDVNSFCRELAEKILANAQRLAN